MSVVFSSLLRAISRFLALWTIQFPRGELHLHLHRCDTLHLSQSELGYSIHRHFSGTWCFAVRLSLSERCFRSPLPSLVSSVSVFCRSSWIWRERIASAGVGKWWSSSRVFAELSPSPWPFAMSRRTRDRWCTPPHRSSSLSRWSSMAHWLDLFSNGFAFGRCRSLRAGGETFSSRTNVNDELPNVSATETNVRHPRGDREGLETAGAPDEVALLNNDDDDETAMTIDVRQETSARQKVVLSLSPRWTTNHSHIGRLVKDASMLSLSLSLLSSGTDSPSSLGRKKERQSNVAFEEMVTFRSIVSRATPFTEPPPLCFY